MSNRLKQIRDALQINQTNFAKQLGISQSAYSMIENQVNPLSDRHIKVVCSVFYVNETWLRTGKGNMFLSSPHEKEFTDIFRMLEPEAQEYLFHMAKELLDMQRKLLNPDRGSENKGA